MSNHDTLKNEILAAIAQVADLVALEEIRIGALGKKGSISQAMKQLGAMGEEERRTAGQQLNLVKEEITQALDARIKLLSSAALDERLKKETVDVTLPIRAERVGHIHPISQTIDEVIAIFADMGFTLAEGPDIEDDFHNFTALNFPPDHPARQMHDTFYMPPSEDGAARLLRTHTSTVQIRALMTQKPPIRVIIPGRTFRSDYDQTHTPMFHQLEGMVIDEATNMAHLRGTLLEFCRAFFQLDDLPIRFRPSFFPFTEPSAEVDIGCSRKDGQLKLGPHGDWLEILGCGMTHPNVIRNCGLDPDKYQGFAFGMGIERLAMLKYGIPDLRTFFDADIRWLSHYGFAALAQPNLAVGL